MQQNQPSPGRIRLQQGRLYYLDGLRGTAALIVVVFHFFSAFVPSLVPDQTAAPLRISDTPLGILYNGRFSVMIFFVLSGFVIAQSASSRRNVFLNLALRYTRLALPSVTSILFAWALLAMMPNGATGLYARMPHPWLQQTYQGSIPGFSSGLWQGFVRVFKEGGDNHFNNVLWTMKIEFFGSSFLYLLYAVLKGKARLLVLTALVLIAPFAHRTIYEGFLFGAILREFWALDRLPRFYPVVSFCTGIVLGGIGSGFHSRMHLLPVAPMFRLGNPEGIFYPIAAMLIVYGCIASPSLHAAFSLRPARFLGRISFSLYLFHVPMLYTLFANTVLKHWPLTPLSTAVLFLAFLLASITVGFVCTLIIDEPVLRMNAALRSRLSVMYGLRLKIT